MARQLARLKVDVIEAGFPAASPGDFEAVRPDRPGDPAGHRGRGARALPRRRPAARDRGAQGRAPAAPPRVHRHERHPPQAQAADRPRDRRSPRRVRWVAPGRSSSAATPRSSSAPRTRRAPTPTSCCRSSRPSVEAGASTLNIPDTVGYAIPPSSPTLDPARASTSCGSRRDVSASTATTTSASPTANTLAAVQAGARQVEVHDQRPRRARRQRLARGGRDGAPDAPDAVRRSSIPASRREHITARVAAGLVPDRLRRSSPTRRSSAATPSPTRAGIHQDGVLKNPLTYEIMTPQSIGLTGSQLTIGKLSGRRGLQGKLRSSATSVEGDALDARLPPGDRASPTRRRTSPMPTSLALVEQRAVRGPRERPRSSAGA